MHVSKQSSIPDHCRAYALSDPNDKDYQMICPHDHLDTCDRCELLSSVLAGIQDALEKMFDSNVSRDVISKISWHGKHTYSEVLIRTKLDYRRLMLSMKVLYFWYRTGP